MILIPHSWTSATLRILASIKHFYNVLTVDSDAAVILTSANK